MSARAPSVVEAVLNVLQNFARGRPPTYQETAPLIIAAVFDNLPRDVMKQAMADLDVEHGCRACNEQQLNAAISAAREAVLGSAKGDANG